MEPPTDAELIEKVRESDPEAFRLLFQRYQPMTFRHALARIGDADEAREIAQEAFYRIWETRGRLDSCLSFPALAFRIASNLAADRGRERERRERLDREIPKPVLSEQDDPGEATSRVLLEEELTRVLNEDVPDRCRSVLLLSRFERLSNKEIADLLGISTKTVENQITRGLAILRKRLKSFTMEGE